MMIHWKHHKYRARVLLDTGCLTPLMSRTWRDRLLGATAGAALTLATLWLILVSADTATVILRA